MSGERERRAWEARPAQRAPGPPAPWILRRVAELDGLPGRGRPVSVSRAAFLLGITQDSVRAARRLLAERRAEEGGG